MEKQTTTTRPALKSVPRPAPEDPNGGGVSGASLETIAKMVSDLTASAHVRKEIDADRDEAIGECLKAAQQARAEAASAKAIGGRVESVVGRIEAAVERIDATVGRFPAPEDAVRAMQRESQRDLTPGQIVEKEAEIRRAAEGTGLCGMVARGARTDVIHAEELRRMAKDAAKEAATEGAAIGVVEGARAGAALVKRGQNARTVGTVAVASTGTLGVVVSVLLALGPDGGARVAGAIRGFFGVLFGGF